MKNVAALSLLVVVALAGTVVPSEAWRGGWHHGHGVHAGPGWWGPPPYWPDRDPRTAYVYRPPSIVIIERPLVYVQSRLTAPPQAYWYYCASARAYYPTVATCVDPWILVPPRE